MIQFFLTHKVDTEDTLLLQYEILEKLVTYTATNSRHSIGPGFILAQLVQIICLY